MPETNEHPAIVVAGPTASGKSQLALILARELGGEIVCCDALQVYRGMDIGTAKPTAEERAAARHHMLDLVEPTQEFSAADYQRLGRAGLEEIRSRRRVPIVVGGTGLYLRALTEGVFEGPGRSAELRARMRRIAERGGHARLHRALARVDPASSQRIPPRDLVRIVRAYEVYLVSGIPLSEWQRGQESRLAGFRWLKLAIGHERTKLYERIDARVDAMFRAGWIDEVRELLGRYPREAPGFKAIGYRQIARHVEGEISLDEAVEDTKRETRRYAKRQLTWFRADPEIRWLDAGAGDVKLEEEARRIAGRFTAP